MSLSHSPELILIAKDLCRTLRKHSTAAEQLFWEKVRNRKLLNKKFYRQHPLFYDLYGKETFFITDFYCDENKLVIEIDGAYHQRQKGYDSIRTEVINCLDIDVIRFTNDEVTKSTELVLKKLKKHLQNLTHPPASSDIVMPLASYKEKGRPAKPVGLSSKNYVAPAQTNKWFIIIYWEVKNEVFIGINRTT